MDFNQLLSMIAAHQWEAVGGLVIAAIVGTAKQGWLGAKIQALLPSRYIPFLTPVYAVLLAESAALIAGDNLSQCLSVAGQAIASAVVATFGHELIIEGARNGKEIIPEKVPAPTPTPKAV
jgi:hypothetical protein